MNTTVPKDNSRVEERDSDRPIGGFKDAQRKTLARIDQAISDGNTAEVERLVTFVKTWWQMPDGTDPKDYQPCGVMVT